jgi:L-fuconolactonase
MFGSNFPVDSLCARFPDILEGCREALAECSPVEQEAFFAGTARRVYALAEPNSTGTA